jgi:hypothetical protein
MTQQMELGAEAAAWHQDVADFLDVKREIPADDQLELMSEFWAEFGQNVPRLDKQQLYNLSAAAEQYPDWRLVPTLLGRLTDRKANVLPKPDSPLTEILDRNHKLWLPEDGAVTTFPEPAHWERLWQGTRMIRESERIFQTKLRGATTPQPEIKSYGLSYLTPEGQMRPRERYLTSLIMNGDAEVTVGIWTFPVIVVSDTRPDQIKKRPSDLYKRLDYIVSPEARLGAQLLHLVAGTPLHPDVTHVTNEVVSELRANGHYRATRGLVGVTRSATEHLLRLSWWNDYAWSDWQLANGISGLQSQTQS